MKMICNHGKVLGILSVVLWVSRPALANGDDLRSCLLAGQTGAQLATQDDPSTHWVCEGLRGEKTLPQLAAQGWSVRAMTPIGDASGQSVLLIISRRKP